MKAKYKELTLWTLLFYFFFIEFRDIIQYNEFKSPISLPWDSSEWLFLSFITTFICYSLATYTALRYSSDKPIIITVFSTLLSIAAILALRFFIEEVVYLKLLGFDNYNDKLTTKWYFLDNLYNALVSSSVGIIFYFVQFSKFKESQRQEILLQKQQTELAFLRSQINPHFLFNTMNNIYTLVYQKSDKALTAVDKLTTLLRYALYEPAERVLLQKEVKYLQDLIDLQSMRYDYKVHLDLQIEAAILSHYIPPFVLIPFVENAFKHGDLRNAAHPLRIHFYKKEEALIFEIINKKRQQQKDKVGGIGLENTKKRLALIYENQHDLQISETTASFQVCLSIPIQLT